MLLTLSTLVVALASAVLQVAVPSRVVGTQNPQRSQSSQTPAIHNFSGPQGLLHKEIES
jgi:hypothetical protein